MCEVRPHGLTAARYRSRCQGIEDRTVPPGHHVEVVVGQVRRGHERSSSALHSAPCLMQRLVPGGLQDPILVTKPSRSRRARASRTGPRLVPTCSAILVSTRRDPGWSWPVRIACRIFAAICSGRVRNGRGSFSADRKPRSPSGGPPLADGIDHPGIESSRRRQERAHRAGQAGAPGARWTPKARARCRGKIVDGYQFSRSTHPCQSKCGRRGDPAPCRAGGTSRPRGRSPLGVNVRRISLVSHPPGTPRPG
jgi:hypothetical protein